MWLAPIGDHPGNPVAGLVPVGSEDRQPVVLTFVISGASVSMVAGP